MSVRLPHAGILSKPLNILNFLPSGSHISFSIPNGMAALRWEPSWRGREMQGGMKKSLSNGTSLNALSDL